MLRNGAHKKEIKDYLDLDVFIILLDRMEYFTSSTVSVSSSLSSICCVLNGLIIGSGWQHTNAISVHIRICSSFFVSSDDFSNLVLQLSSTYKIVITDDGYVLPNRTEVSDNIYIYDSTECIVYTHT